MFSASFRLSESESERILHSKNLDGEIFYLWTLAVRYCTTLASAVAVLQVSELKRAHDIVVPSDNQLSKVNNGIKKGILRPLAPKKK